MLLTAATLLVTCALSKVYDIELNQFSNEAHRLDHLNLHDIIYLHGVENATTGYSWHLT